MSINILVADDSPTIQKVIQITLDHNRYELESSLTFEALNQELKNKKFHLVLLDFYLDQEVNGYQIARAIKDEHPGTKVIMMFGTFDEFDTDRLKEFGVEGHVVKPFESKAFISLCEDILNNDELILVEALQENEVSEWKIDSDEFVSLPDEDQINLSGELDYEAKIDKAFINNKYDEDIKDNEDDLLSLKLDNDIDFNIEGDVPRSFNKNILVEIEKPPIIDNLANVESSDDLFFDKKSNIDLMNNSFEKDIENSCELNQLPIAEDLDYPEIMTSASTADSNDNTFSFDFKSSDDEIKSNQVKFLDNETNSEISSEEFWAIDLNDDNSDNTTNSISDDLASEKEILSNNQFKNNELRLSSKENNTISNDLLVELEAKILNKIKSELDIKIKQYCEDRILEFSKKLFPEIANQAIENEIKRLSEMVDSENH